MKQVVDWASRPHGLDAPLGGKPVAAVGASVTAYGSIGAQDHLRKTLGVAGTRVLPAELAVANAPEQFSAEGELTDPETRERLAELVAELVAHHGQFLTA